MNTQLSRLAVLAICALMLGSCARAPKPNVIIFTFDTTRADHIGCYGLEPDASTPNLDGIAAGAGGFLFERASTSNPVTQPAHSTIMTGVYPLSHGVRDNMLFHLPEEIDTLAEMLKAEGYVTGAAIGGFPLVKEFGIDQGFDYYDDNLTADRRDHRGRPRQRSRQTWYDERPASQVNAAILPWLRDNAGAEEPFFTWIHYWDPHEPLIAPSPFDQRFAHDPYLGEIAYADAAFGVILAELEALGVAENTIVIMTADHGESHYEHNEATHAFLAHESSVHVPMIWRVPFLAGNERFGEHVGTVDIVPTILDLVGAELPDQLQGRSLASLMRGDHEMRLARDYYAESMSPRLSHGYGELRVLYRGDDKLIHGPKMHLYDLSEDPREVHDLWAERPDEAAVLEEALARFVAEHASDEAGNAVHEVSDEAREKLAALGYLQTSGSAAELEVGEELRRDGTAPEDRVQDINLVFRLRDLISRGQFTLAEKVSRELFESAPDNPFFQAKLVTALVGLQRLDEALELIDSFDSIDPSALEDFIEAAHAAVNEGRTQRGVELAERLVEIAPSAHHWNHIGELLEAAEASAQRVAAAYEAALELDEGDRRALLALSRIDLEAQRWDLARARIEPVLGEFPNDPEALLLSARIESGAGHLERSDERLQRVLRLNPAFCGALSFQVESLEGRDEDGAELARRELDRRCPGHQERQR